MKTKILLLSFITLASANVFAETKESSVVQEYEQNHQKFVQKKTLIVKEKQQQINAQKEIQQQENQKRLTVKKIEDNNIQQMTPENQSVATLLKNSQTADYRVGTFVK